METVGLKIYITRGESFSIDFSVKDKTGRPYVVLNKIQNPYLKITVTNYKYNASKNYVKSWWLDLTNGYNENGEHILLPRFSSVEPKEVNSISEVGNADTDTEHYLYRVIGDNKYYYNDGEVKEYDFRIVKTFLSGITSEWIEKQYTYDIKLLGGQTVVDYVQGLVRAHELIPSDTPIESDLNSLLSLFVGHEELLEGVHLDGRPLQNEDINQDILTPTEIFVASDSGRS